MEQSDIIPKGFTHSREGYCRFCGTQIYGGHYCKRCAEKRTKGNRCKCCGKPIGAREAYCNRICMILYQKLQKCIYSMQEGWLMAYDYWVSFLSQRDLVAKYNVQVPYIQTLLAATTGTRGHFEARHLWGMTKKANESKFKSYQKALSRERNRLIEVHSIDIEALVAIREYIRGREQSP